VVQDGPDLVRRGRLGVADEAYAAKAQVAQARERALAVGREDDDADVAAAGGRGEPEGDDDVAAGEPGEAAGGHMHMIS
jgi:hypothetical protein